MPEEVASHCTKLLVLVASDHRTDDRIPDTRKGRPACVLAANNVTQTEGDPSDQDSRHRGVTMAYATIQRHGETHSHASYSPSWTDMKIVHHRDISGHLFAPDVGMRQVTFFTPSTAREHRDG